MWCPRACDPQLAGGDHQRTVGKGRKLRPGKWLHMDAEEGRGGAGCWTRPLGARALASDTPGTLHTRIGSSVSRPRDSHPPGSSWEAPPSGWRLRCPCPGPLHLRWPCRKGPAPVVTVCSHCSGLISRRGCGFMVCSMESVTTCPFLHVTAQTECSEWTLLRQQLS